jgi:hypothetical protein
MVLAFGAIASVPIKTVRLHGHNTIEDMQLYRQMSTLGVAEIKGRKPIWRASARSSPCDGASVARTCLEGPRLFFADGLAHRAAMRFSEAYRTELVSRRSSICASLVVPLRVVGMAQQSRANWNHVHESQSFALRHPERSKDTDWDALANGELLATAEELPSILTPAVAAVYDRRPISLKQPAVIDRRYKYGQEHGGACRTR